jgi:hypothetical protein
MAIAMPELAARANSMLVEGEPGLNAQLIGAECSMSYA